jgi:hypothetical protein
VFIVVAALVALTLLAWLALIAGRRRHEPRRHELLARADGAAACP